MPLITAFDLGKSYGADDIFSHLSLSIPHRARIGLVGANGVGKTTLLRILNGLEEPSNGEVQRARGLRVGYLAQEAGIDAAGTLWEECQNSFPEVLALQAEMAHLEVEMGVEDKTESALEAYGRVQLHFDRLGGYDYEQRIRYTLSGLGFSESDYLRPMPQLSGGQRTRALLARLLLQNPDLLLLDEPTNHLDIAAIEWLESYLHDWRGATLIVSHDRYFLDQVVSAIWEMTPVLELYRGNYTAYLQQRTERYQRRLEETQTQQEFIAKEGEYIRRNIAGQNTRQAQGRRKRLERMLEEALLIPPVHSRRLNLRLEPVMRSGDLVLRTYGLQVGYADEGHPLFTAPDLTLRRGECAAILGPNGAGKTTFLKTLLEHVPPYGGDLSLGANLKIGYFAQAHEGLHLDWTPMKEIEAVAPHMLPAEMRDYLARFLFSGDEVFKEVRVLSGGERGRLALACLALQGANLLLLDEPTNHLDLPSQEVLQAILADYRGTILLVSHDRYLIDALGTQIWEVITFEGTLQVYEGTYSEYKAWKAERAAQVEAEAARARTPVIAGGAAAGDASAGEARPLSSVIVNGAKQSPAQTDKVTPLSKMEQKKLRMRLDGLEAKISEIEAHLATITRQLEVPAPDPARIHKLGLEYVRLQAHLDELMIEWEALHS
jgi:ATP-binding cassette subfamily F protein 3